MGRPPPGCVDQSPEMEHHLRWDKDRLLEVYDKPEPEVIAETEVASVVHLVNGHLSMEMSLM